MGRRAREVRAPGRPILHALDGHGHDPGPSPAGHRVPSLVARGRAPRLRLDDPGRREPGTPRRTRARDRAERRERGLRVAGRRGTRRLLGRTACRHLRRPRGRGGPRTGRRRTHHAAGRDARRRGADVRSGRGPRHLALRSVGPRRPCRAPTRPRLRSLRRRERRCRSRHCRGHGAPPRPARPGRARVRRPLAVGGEPDGRRPGPGAGRRRRSRSSPSRRTRSRTVAVGRT